VKYFIEDDEKKEFFKAFQNNKSNKLYFKMSYNTQIYFFMIQRIVCSENTYLELLQVYNK